LLREPEEEQPTVARPAAIEAKGELIQVVVEMLEAHRPLMRAQQPALE
jgi:hypothetical protein